MPVPLAPYPTLPAPYTPPSNGIVQDFVSEKCELSGCLVLEKMDRSS